MSESLRHSLLHEGEQRSQVHLVVLTAVNHFVHKRLNILEFFFKGQIINLALPLFYLVPIHIEQTLEVAKGVVRRPLGESIRHDAALTTNVDAATLIKKLSGARLARWLGAHIRH